MLHGMFYIQDQPMFIHVELILLLDKSKLGFPTFSSTDKLGSFFNGYIICPLNLCKLIYRCNSWMIDLVSP